MTPLPIASVLPHTTVFIVSYQSTNKVFVYSHSLPRNLQPDRTFEAQTTKGRTFSLAGLRSYSEVAYR